MATKNETIEALKQKNRQQAEEIIRMRKQNVEAISQLSRSIDSILAACAIKYGIKVLDPDDNNKLIGYRLYFPIPDTEKKYEVRVERCHRNKGKVDKDYRIGVLLPEEGADTE